MTVGRTIQTHGPDTALAAAAPQQTWNIKWQAMPINTAHCLHRCTTRQRFRSGGTIVPARPL